MSLSAAERDAAFLFYSLAFAGTPMPVPLPTVSSNDEEVSVAILAAAIALGARGHMRGADPLTRAEVAAAVEAALGERPEAEAPIDASADIKFARLDAYQDGRSVELTALETWANSDEREGTLSSWIAKRRAAGPKRGVTAREVVERLESWRTDQSDRRGSARMIADLRAEIEGGHNG